MISLKKKNIFLKEFLDVLLLCLASTAAGTAAAAAGATARTRILRMSEHLLLTVDQTTRQNVVLVSLHCFDAVVHDPAIFFSQNP